MKRPLENASEFSVGGVRVRPRLGKVGGGDGAVHIEPRSMEVLLALAANGREVYAKKELIEAVWGDAFVGDEVLTHAIWDLRRAFGDDASHPRFIETIPKRGYRLVGEVAIPEPEEDPVTERSERSGGIGLLPIVLLVAAALALSLYMASNRTVAPEATESGDVESAKARLDKVFVVADPTAEGQIQKGTAQKLAKRVADELNGGDRIEVANPRSCPELENGDYCLEIVVGSSANSQTARVRLLQSNDAPRFTPAYETLFRPSEIAEAAKKLSSQVNRYFQVIDHAFYFDEDTRAWFNLSEDRIDAIYLYLQAAANTYQHEKGSSDYLKQAVEVDPNFAIGYIWQIPGALGEDPDEVDALIANLERVDRLSPLEKAMIEWAKAARAPDLPLAARYLDDALDIAPGHRPIRLLLATNLENQGRRDRAFDEHYRDLVDGNWSFPGLYALAAECQILLDDLHGARVTLKKAMTQETEDPHALWLLQAIATYDGDDSKALDYLKRLRTRLKVLESFDDLYDFSESAARDWLVEHAEKNGRPKIAKKLRELSD